VRRVFPTDHYSIKKVLRAQEKKRQQEVERGGSGEAEKKA